MQQGLVSVMMPAYNAGRYIGEAIESVLAQTFSNWELLVVNDGSTDDTAAVVARFQDPRIHLISKANGGESSARNVALERSRGEFIAYLDADDAYLPHHLAVTVAFLEANPQRDAVYVDGIHIDEFGRRLASLQSRRRGPFEGRIYNEVVRASDVFGPPMTVVLRHALVARHGLRYDTRIVIGPDWDFFIRVADIGSFGYLAEQTGLYRVHQTNISTQVDRPRRAGYLAICRENAIRGPRFNACPVDVRAAVFYDLLINLLRGQPGRRAAVFEWSEFVALPAGEQARLLRLTAASAMQHDRDREHVAEWLRRAATLNPADTRAVLLTRAYGLSPRLCSAVFKAISRFRGERVDAGPFADLARAA
jgi:glycosyltransferase involved in cell wall biosynthesis